MKFNRKFFNLLFFASLTGCSTSAAAAMGYWLCLMFYNSPYNFYSYSIPESLYWATGAILPVLSFLQSLCLFKIYLFVQNMKNKKIRAKILPFTAIFVTIWSALSPWALAYGAVFKYGHVGPPTIAEIYPRVWNSFILGAPTLLNVLVVALCIGVYGTFVWFAGDNLFGEYFQRRKAIHQ